MKESIAEMIARKKAVIEQMVETEDNNLPGTGTSPEPDTDEVTAKGMAEGTQPQQGTLPPPDLQPQPEPSPEPQIDTGTDTDTLTDTDTVLQQMLKPSENYVRKVYYPLDYQAKFISKQAKKYKRTESEIVRIMFDYFMKNGKI